MGRGDSRSSTFIIFHFTEFAKILNYPRSSFLNLDNVINSLSDFQNG